MVEFRIASMQDLREDDVVRFDFYGRPAIAYRVGDRPVAAIDACTHSGGPLALDAGQLRCQWHGACFEREQGFARSRPADAGSRLTLLPVEVRSDGSVWYVYAQPTSAEARAFPPAERAAACGDGA